MNEDIREKSYLEHEDVIQLNFIRSPGIYGFRRHYRTGLRSHIMEVLRSEDVEEEKRGILVNGLRWFPRARPIRMLRIFRIKFRTIEEAQEEIKKVKIIEKYLGPAHYAKSDEFLVDYIRSEKCDILLCGLQAYVMGEIIDPWSPVEEDVLTELLRRMAGNEDNELPPTVSRVKRARLEAEDFIGRIKKMILEAHYVPDLAGQGNLILTPEGLIKLVDINNVSGVSFSHDIPIDDRGYPVCDKSIQALALLEKKILGINSREIDRIYEVFLSPQRMGAVRAIERRFHESMKATFASRN